MDTTDSIQEFVGRNNNQSSRSKVPLLILIFSFIILIITLSLIIYIITKIKDFDSKENNQNKLTNQTPIIGLTGMRLPGEGETKTMIETPFTYDNVQIHYLEVIEKAGGIPIALPVLQTLNIETIKKQLDLVDGILIPGGIDVDPFFYNEERNELLEQTNLQTDQYIIEVIKQAKDKKIPILGIGKGLQIINVAFGGSLFQDLSIGGKETSHHKQDSSELCTSKHSITISKNSLFEKIFPDKKNLEVNSWHHQAINKPGEKIEVDAFADDGVIEAIHYKDNDLWIFGVQFHPEQNIKCGNNEFMPIFTEFIKQAQKLKDSK